MAQVAGWGLWSLVGSSSIAARGTPPSPLFGHSWPVIAAGRGAVGYGYVHNPRLMLRRRDNERHCTASPSLALVKILEQT